MKLGATATSPGVTARWVYQAKESVLFARRHAFIARVWRAHDGVWRAWSVYLDGGRMVPFTHRYQAKRAVEAAVSQALREAGE